jgi:hypothetical protein
MTTYTIDWSDNVSLPPSHQGLNPILKNTIIRSSGVVEMKDVLLSSLVDKVGLKSLKRSNKWQINPLGWGKVELRNREEVYIGWIEMEYTK